MRASTCERRSIDTFCAGSCDEKASGERLHMRPRDAGVDVEHRARVLRPDEAVADGHRTEFLLYALVRMHNVERTCRGAIRTEVHSSGPEASGGVAFAVVETVGGEGGFRIRDAGDVTC